MYSQANVLEDFIHFAFLSRSFRLAFNTPVYIHQAFVLRFVHQYTDIGINAFGHLTNESHGTPRSAV